MDSFQEEENITVLPTDYDLIDALWQTIYPTHYEWALIVGYILVFIFAILGNGLVCVVVARNSHMRTVTNYFIANLSAGDLLVTIICLPPTLVVDIMETWFFGETMCKFFSYMQMVSVSVSVLTLCAVAVERWYAIVHPLKFKSTPARARNIIICIWVTSFLVTIPLLLVSKTSHTFESHITNLFVMCDEHWPENTFYGQIYHSAILGLIYIVPLCIISIAYTMIVWKLWSNQISLTVALKVTGNDVGKRRGSLVGQFRRSLRLKNSADFSTDFRPYTVSPADECPPSPRSQTVSPVEEQPPRSASPSKDTIGQRSGETIFARRKVARMLIAVVIIFAVCWAPSMVMNFMKRVLGSFDVTYDRGGLYAAYSVAHWLIYFNSAINPVIYGFLSEKFRNGFQASLGCPQAVKKKQNLIREVTVTRPTISRVMTTKTTSTADVGSRLESIRQYPFFTETVV
ncbi:orexin/Hypocretin receptor type 1-like [Branchiostoma lanceolatum]|uniref:HCRTR2 protein n=1 Tax=Branchiostoma lanceolatum TaxID=7740 RepID=A0A8J9ZJ44_BRALA|nr:HCRTR2 [Branchiostoma lanceolatum]